ncbi:sulfotransferase [Nitrosococcus watsonii]|uniref:Glycosyl transferase family 2 n=1 Tax=Nitrosococcus watsoni (strain C-113) TaxID=105559 RepID=D8K577_NITWC|nr:sulfotransferase [Nitrosococcus watsonii]ADJ28054.1 glycosyl transferase family 2 [Nitrosococcus watsonii C-113]
MADSSSVVFLLGVPRSGTTLLSWLLNQHRSIYCPPEPWLLLGLESLGQVPTDHAADPPLLSSAITEFLGVRRLQRLKRAALSIYQYALEEAGKFIFIDKTPRNYHALDFVQAFLPEGKIIFLVRNPLDVAASFKTSWSVDLPKIIANQEDTPFLFDYILGFNRLLAFEENYSVLRVCYEDLVAAPEKQMVRIFKYLGLPLQAINKDLDIQETTYARSSLGDKKILSTSSIHRQSIGAYKRVFKKGDIQILLNSLGEKSFSKLGYGKQYEDACAEFEITPCNKMSPQLLKITEGYAQQRQRRCYDLQSRGIFEQKIEYLSQQIARLKQQNEIVQNRNKDISNELKLAQAQNSFLNKQLDLSQIEKEEFKKQFYSLQNMGLKARLRGDLGYLKKRLKQKIKDGLWRAVQGPPAPPLPRITIVTPVLNGAQFIEATLRSVLIQAYPALEFIIVDGGSTDDTLSIIDKIQNDPDFKDKISCVISEPDRGMYDAIAKGFSRATGEILAYLNADDLLEGGALDAVGDYFSHHPRVAVIYHEDTVLVNGWKYPNIRQPRGINTVDLLNKHILFQDGVFFRREAYQAIGGLRRDLKLAGDYDLWLRLSARFKFIRRAGHVSCFRIRQGQFSENMEAYNEEMDRARHDFLSQASRLQALRWQFQKKYTFFSDLIRKISKSTHLFFPLDFSNLPPPPITLDGTEYGQALSPIDGRPAEQFLFSTPDTRFGDKGINYIYLDTRHSIAVTHPPIQPAELDRLYQRHYSAPLSSINSPEGPSPYRQFSGKRRWEKLLLRLPVERWLSFFSSNDLWLDNTLNELSNTLQSSQINIHSPLRVLDAGCFEGHLLDGIAAARKSWRGYGLEPNPQAVEIARSKGHCVWQGGAEDAAEIIPAPYQFDVIFMGQSIEHVDNPVRVLRRLRLLLAPGGVLVVSTPNLDSRQINWFGPTWAHWHAPYHRYIFSRKGLLALARQTGLHPVCFKTFSHCYWTAMSLMQNFIGLGGSVPHTIDFDFPLRAWAQRINFWQQLFWNRIGKGDYCFFVMRDKESG